jgi:hypothetical protein
MSNESILSLIDAEIAKLTQVRTLLAGVGNVSIKMTGRKVKLASPVKTIKRRVLSPEARKRIADAQRRRWAAQRAKKK